MASVRMLSTFRSVGHGDAKVNIDNPVAPLLSKPVEDVTRTDYLPTRREEQEGRHHHDAHQGSSQQREERPNPSPEAIPDGTFIDSLTSFDPIFDQYRHRIPHLAPQLSADQRHLLGALYATAAHSKYDLARIDAIAKRFVMEGDTYAKRVMPNPMAAAGLVIDTQA